MRRKHFAFSWLKAFLLSLVFMVSFAAAAAAQEPENDISRETEEFFDWEPETEPLLIEESSVSYCPDEEFRRYYNIGNYEYVDKNPVYFGISPNASVTDRYYTQLDDISKEIYDLLYSTYQDSPSSEKIALGLVTVFKNQTITKGEDGKTKYSDATKAAIFDWLGSYVTPAFLALVNDHPEMCWLSGATYKIGYSAYGFYFPAGVDSMVVDIELAGSSFTLAANSALSGLNQSTLGSLFTAAKNEVQASLPASAGRYEIVKEIHDWICRKVTYESNASQKGNPVYQTPYSLFVDADGDGVVETVCAGYAKMMKVLCDRYGIPCVLIVGTTYQGEAHMWNYIQMENGKWYGVDATWDDQTTILYDFLLAGGNTVAGSFGTRTFSDMHLPSGKWSSSEYAVFAYPALSNEGYAQTPSAPTGFTAAVKGSSVQLSWNSVAGATGYRIFKSEGGTGAVTAEISAGTASGYLDTAVAAGSSYSYTVCAENAFGQGSKTDACSVCLKPSAPTNLAVSSVSGGVQLTWTASAGATGYVILRSDTNNTVYNKTISAGNVTSYLDTTAPAGVTCRYTVRAVNAGGTSANASGKSIAVEEPVVKPSAPTNLTVSNVSGGVQLTWTASAGATSYVIFRSDTNSTSYNKTISAGNVTSYLDTTAPAGVTCRYTVRAVNAAGTSANASGKSITVAAPATEKPSAPTNFTVSNVSGGVQLTWTASAGATSYVIFRSDTNSTAYNKTISVGNVTSYLDTTAPAGVTCRYTVRAVNAAGTSSNADGKSITVGVIVEKPSAPTNFAVSNVSGGVQLTWTASAGATSYVILRSDTNSTSYNKNITVGNVTSYLDTTAPSGVTCRYTVRAVNSTGSSSNASGKSITVQ